MPAPSEPAGRRESSGSDSWRRIAPWPASPTHLIYKRADGYTVATRFAFPYRYGVATPDRAECGMSGRVESVPGRKDQPSVEPQGSLAGPDGFDPSPPRILSPPSGLPLLVRDDQIRPGSPPRPGIVSVWSP